MSTLLEVRDLRVVYEATRGGSKPVAAVDGVTFQIEQGETLGVVGESGSGKSTIGRAILGLTPAADGQIIFDGVDITHADKRHRRDLSRELQCLRRPDRIAQPDADDRRHDLRAHLRPRASESCCRSDTCRRDARAGWLATEAARQYPRQFSGGQRQRIAIRACARYVATARDL